MSSPGGGDEIQAAGPVPALIITYDTILIFGLTAWILVLLTAWFGPDVKRTGAWYSFAGAWIFYTVSFLLLLGSQIGTRPPSPGLCAIQASLIYSTPVMCSWACVSLMLQLFFSITRSMANKTVGRTRELIPLLLPHVLFLAVFLPNLIFAALRPDLVEINNPRMYCDLNEMVSTIPSGILVLIASATLLGIEGKLFSILYKSWGLYRNTVPNPDAPFTMLIRLSLFSFLPIAASIISVLWSVVPTWVTSGQEKLLPAALPLVGALIFGSQKDIYKTWTSQFPSVECIRRKPPPPIAKDP